MPARIQLKRTRGWRKPEGVVVVARPGPFGNPFTPAGYLDVWNPKATPEEARAGCVAMFRDWLNGHLGEDARLKRLRELLPSLRGKDLACWCPLTYPDGTPCPCHADVLLEAANA